MPREDLEERLLDAWIGLNGLLKNSRMTDRLTYNEAIVMRLVYRCRDRDGEERVSVKYLLRQTNMLKSLLNRTVDSLCAQGFLIKERDEGDRRSLYVRIVPEKVPDFLAVHERSIRLARSILDTIGPEDAEAFVRCCSKLMSADIETGGNKL